MICGFISPSNYIAGIFAQTGLSSACPKTICSLRFNTCCSCCGLSGAVKSAGGM